MLSDKAGECSWWQTGIVFGKTELTFHANCVTLGNNLHEMGNSVFPEKIVLKIRNVVRWRVKGNEYTFNGDNSVQKVYVPFWKGMYSIRKEFAPKGSNSFLTKYTNLQKGIGDEDSKQEVTKGSPLWKMAAKSPDLCIPIESILDKLY